MRYFLAMLLTSIMYKTIAQQKLNATPAEIFQQLEQLKNCNTVLYIAAHPDDENTRLLSWFANVKHYRTAYLSLTRGDGGQNLIGDEQGIPLGIIRTQELLAARRIDGAEQYFTRAYDFGFSKTSEETLRFWNKEDILSDVVWVIRNLKPDIIISRFPKDKRAGHGHHASAGILAEEAFKAAADAKKFPEQLKYVTTWQAKRVLWNSFNFGTTNTTSETQFKIITGDYIPALGKSVGELAAESRSMHKSQGFGVPMQRGNIAEYFETWGGDAPTTTLMDGVSTSWNDVAGGEQVAAAIDHAINTYDFKNPSATTLKLTTIYKLINGLPDSFHLKKQKLSIIKNAIAATAGIYVEALSSYQNVAKGDSTNITLGMINRSELPVKFIGAKIFEQTITIGKNKDLLNNNNVLAKNIWYAEKQFLQLAKNVPARFSYWTERGIVNNKFNITDQTKIGKAEINSDFEAEVVIEVHGVPIPFNIPIQYKIVDPVKGEMLQPLQIVAPSSVMPKNNVVLTAQKPTTTIDYNVKHFYNGLVAASNSTKKDEMTPITKGGVQSFSSLLPKDKKPELALQYTDFANNYNKEMHQINYDHIPLQTYYSNATVKIINEKVNIAKKKIGYINGAGDKVVEGLLQMGYEVSMIDKDKMNMAVLQQYDAIITGVRAYNTNDWLQAAYPTLMNYVQNGGNLIVQYNTNSGVGPLKINIGPYPFTISRTRVTEEDAIVHITTPSHIVFNKPNKITNDDWNGWIQERSIYHAEAFDSTKYIAPISMNDKDEKPDNGSLIIAKHGKGNFVYTGIVFFREIPAGVVGAYKLLANIIELPKNK